MINRELIKELITDLSSQGSVNIIAIQLQKLLDQNTKLFNETVEQSERIGYLEAKVNELECQILVITTYTAYKPDKV